jgi:hypothetical protein
MQECLWAIRHAITNVPSSHTPSGDREKSSEILVISWNGQKIKPEVFQLQMSLIVS